MLNNTQGLAWVRHTASWCEFLRVQMISLGCAVTPPLETCPLVEAAVTSRSRRWRSRICWSSERDVTRGGLDLGRSATDPVCWTGGFRLSVVCLLHPTTRTTCANDCPGSTVCSYGTPPVISEHCLLFLRNTVCPHGTLSVLTEPCSRGTMFVLMEPCLFSRNTAYSYGTLSVLVEHCLCLWNNVCSHGTLPVLMGNVMFFWNYLCYYGTISVVTEQCMFSRNTVCSQ